MTAGVGCRVPGAGETGAEGRADADTGHRAPVAGTVGEALARAGRALHAAGVPDARREAGELFGALVQGPTSTAWLRRDEALRADLRLALETAVERRASGWPQAYAAGWADFRGHWLEVDRRVLIPRPETEGLVEAVLDWAAASRDRLGASGIRWGSVVDVGTGSGAIAIALAVEGPFARVFAVDRSAGALAVARRNAVRLGVGARVAVLQGDLLEPLAGLRLEAVVCNPPYVATAELAALDHGVRAYEPEGALDGGPDGLGPTRRLVEGARRALAPGGLLALEVDSRRADATATVARAAGFSRVAVRDDLFKRPRYVTALQPGDR